MNTSNFPISRQNLGRSGNSGIPDRLGFFRHMKTRLKFPHITTALYELHWLHITYRIKFKILILTFKSIYGLGPSYLNNLIQVKSKSSYALRSNNSLLLEATQDIMRPTLVGRSFTFAAPALWNSLSADLRDVTSLGVFKNKLKTFL